MLFKTILQWIMVRQKVPKSYFQSQFHISKNELTALAGQKCAEWPFGQKICATDPFVYFFCPNHIRQIFVVKKLNLSVFGLLEIFDLFMFTKTGSDLKSFDQVWKIHSGSPVSKLL